MTISIYNKYKYLKYEVPNNNNIFKIAQVQVLLLQVEVEVGNVAYSYCSCTVDSR